MRSLPEIIRDLAALQTDLAAILEDLHALHNGRPPPFHLDHASAARLLHLTPRQRQVLEAIARGHANKQIAHDLSLAHSTISNYVSTILHTMGVPNRAAAAVLAIHLGLEKPPHHTPPNPPKLPIISNNTPNPP